MPLDSMDEQAKFLTTLLMLEDLHEGRPGARIGHPERLQSDEEVMTELFKMYQNQVGKHAIGLHVLWKSLNITIIHAIYRAQLKMT